MRSSYFTAETVIQASTGGTSRINVTGTDNIYSRAIPVGSATKFSVETVAEGGAVVVNVDVEISFDGTNFFAYSGYSSPVLALVAAGRTGIGFTLPPCSHMRFKFDGQAGNHATTTYVTTKIGRIFAD